MRILGIGQRVSGCSYHRVVLPMVLMDNVTGKVCDEPTAEMLAQGYDILMYNRVSPFDEHWEKTREDLGVKVVCDIDDDWNLPGNHIAWEIYESIKPRIINNIQTADMVLCTNENLYSKVIKLNANAHIIPNAIPYGFDQFHHVKLESEFIRLFWCGSITHEHDINILKYPLRRLSDKRIQMVMGGYSTYNEYTTYIWDRMASVFTSNKKHEFKLLSGMEPDRYMEMYQEGDIMLIPLEQSSWHASKSNLKVLEAAAKRMPCIVSRVEPYSKDADAPVLWVDRQTDWLKHINYLINNKSAREDYGEKLHEWAKENYNYKRINDHRAELLRGLCKA